MKNLFTEFENIALDAENVVTNVPAVLNDFVAEHNFQFGHRTRQVSLNGLKQHNIDYK